MTDRSECINTPLPSSTLAPVGLCWIKFNLAGLKMDILLTALVFPVSFLHSFMDVSRDHLPNKLLVLSDTYVKVFLGTETMAQSVGEGEHIDKSEECYKEYNLLQATIFLLSFLCENQDPFMNKKRNRYKITYFVIYSTGKTFHCLIEEGEIQL